MITAGITGGIGSGKTTICREWEKSGAYVFYADEVAKKLMQTREAVKKQLIKTFGSDTYAPDGSLNRQHLAAEAFEKGRVEELNRIVHPAVADEFNRVRKKIMHSGVPLMVKEAALLLRNGRPPELDVIVIVRSKREDRVRRVVKRDRASREEVLARDRKQPDVEQLLHLADYIIENNGTLEDLKKQSARMFDTLLQEHGTK